MAFTKDELLKRRHIRVRRKITGNPERPRLSVRRSHLNLNVQIVDDYAEKTLLSVSSLSPEFRKKAKSAGNVEAAKLFGQFVAGEMKKKGLQKIAFDRGGYLYHGRVKALADSLRENGIQF